MTSSSFTLEPLKDIYSAPREFSVRIKGYETSYVIFIGKKRVLFEF
jgi:hypothetical protein